MKGLPIAEMVSNFLDDAPSSDRQSRSNTFNKSDALYKYTKDKNQVALNKAMERFKQQYFLR